VRLSLKYSATVTVSRHKDKDGTTQNKQTFQEKYVLGKLKFFKNNKPIETRLNFLLKKSASSKFKFFADTIGRIL